jgi:hypothetical protein
METKEKVKKTLGTNGKKTEGNTPHTASMCNFIKMANRKKILAYEGQGIWEGNLDEMRIVR